MADTDEKTKGSSASSRRETDEEQNRGFSVLDGLRIIVGLLLLNCLLSYFITGDSFLWGYKPWWIRPNALVAKLVGQHDIRSSSFH